MTRPLDTTKFPDLSADALGFDPDALALVMWRFNNPYADPAAWRQQSKPPAPRAARKPRQPGKPRRPSISKMIEQAEQAGKPLASLTLPDGTKLDFSQPESVAPENPWPLDEFRPKETKQ